MTTFEYKGFTESGRLSRGLIEALDRKEAREKLSRRGILTETVSVAGGGRRWWGVGRRTPFTLETRAMIYRELAALVHAGLTVAAALDLLVNSPETGEHRALLASVHDKIREGVPLAEALGTASPEVSALETSVIQVGERTGSLDEVLQRLATFLEEQQAMREKVTTALMYPTLVFILAVGIGLAVLGLMVPRIGTLLLESGVELPLLTRVMMTLAQGVSAMLVPGLLVGVLAFIGIRMRWRQDPGMRTGANRLLYRLPGIGQAYTALVSLRFARTLSLLIRGGVPLVEGLPLAGRATGSGWLSGLVDRETERVRQGESVADALRAVPPLQASLPGWVDAGETSGDLAGLLEHAGDRYQRQWDRLTARMLALLEPILVLGIGVFVLLIALSILLPVLSMNQQIQ